MTSPASRVPVYGLDIVRLLAALAVVFYHFGFNAFAVENNQILKLAGAAARLPDWWEWTWFGWIGVQVFFVISGLVISYSVEGSTAHGFAQKRALRLLPVVWISAAFALPVALLVFGLPARAAAIQLVKTVTFFPIGPWLMGQFWTLPIEVVFYGLIWLLILVRRGASLELLAWLLAAEAALYAFVTRGLGFSDPTPRLTALLLLQHGQYFALGILGSLVDRRGYRWRHLLLASVCVGLAAIEINTVAVSDPHLSPLAGRWYVPFIVWLTMMGFVWGSFHWKNAIAAAAAPSAKLIRHIGLITFPIYTLHIHAGGPVLGAMRADGVPSVLAIFAGALVAVGTASLVVVWLEPRVRALVERLVFIRKARPPQTVASLG